MFVVQIQPNRASDFKVFAPVNAAELAEPMGGSSASAPQRTENTALGKERKQHGQALWKTLNTKVNGGAGDGDNNFIILEIWMGGEKEKKEGIHGAT